MPSATLGAALFAAVVAAQSGIQLITTSGLATLCVPYNAEPTFGPTPVVIAPINVGQAINVNIVAPSCNSCGCQGDGCTAINIYQTTYNNFNSVGALTSQVYIVTEQYPGVAPSAKPSVVTLPCPLGFTTTVETCTVGPTPTSATLTVPVTTCAFVTGLSTPSPVPAGVSVPPYELCTTGFPPAPTGAAPPAAAPAAAPPAAAPPAAAPPAAAPPAAAPPAAAPPAAAPPAAAPPAAAPPAAAPPAAAPPAAAPPAAAPPAAAPPAAAPPAAAPPAAATGSGATGAAPPAAPAPAAPNAGTPPAANTASGPAPASSTYVQQASGSRPVVSLFLGCTLGFVLSLVATF